MYFEQFEKEEIVFIQETIQDRYFWRFDRKKYKAKLIDSLPIDDFFTWCADTLKIEKDNFRLNEYFMLTSLLFEEDCQVVSRLPLENSSIITQQGVLQVPKISIEKNEGISQ